ncbi:MAG: HAD family phosphatase [Pirellulales bacterium]
MQQFAVIFDMDGVLVDSYHAHFESWRLLYGELGRNYSEAEFAADFGRTSRDILRRTLGSELSDAQIRDFDLRKESLYRDIIRQSFPAMDGAIELIEALAADGFLLAIGSSGPTENIDLCLERMGSSERFVAVVTGADVTRGKPDPQVFLLAAERLGVQPKLCCVVEDAPHGVEAARNAGMKCVALTGTATRDQLDRSELVVDSLRELTPALVRNLIVRGLT